MTVDGLTAGAVARRLGVAVTTLRTWHQRYGLGPSTHAPGQHRRYSPDDIARLELMQRLTADGVPPGEAARWVRRVPVSATRTSPGQVPGQTSSGQLPAEGAAGRSGTTAPSRSGAGGLSGPGSARTPAGQYRPAPDRAPGAPVPSVRGPARRDGGGRALALGRAVPEARGLARALTRLDSPAVHQILTDAIRDRGVISTWDDVVRPVLAAVGRRAAATGEMIEVEHVLSNLVSIALGAVPRPPLGTPVGLMLACADEEQHSLPLEAIAAALAERGVPSRMLGARVPPTALRAAIRRTGPTAVVIWSHDPSTADPAVLRAILSGRGRPMLVVAAGPGWHQVDLPAGVGTVDTLAEAVTVLSAAVSA